MKIIDSILNKMTMYRLVVYGLLIISFIAILLSFIGRLPMNPSVMILSIILLLASTFVSEWILSKIWRRPLNSESWLITALIIFLIFPAPKSALEVATTIMVGVLATSSKYFISWNGKHIFNPAAFAVVTAGLLNLQITTWWVGNAAMWPFTLLFGLLVVRKIRRFTMVLTFVGVTLVLQLITFAVSGTLILATMQSILVASPLIFLSTIMLTEPATIPPRRLQQIIFATIIAVLYVEAWKIGPISIYPEVALLIGNIYAFIISPKFKIELTLKEVQKISERVYNYVFIPTQRFNFIPGQYMEWTLPHVAFDSRGNRRSFTIASSPTENVVQLGVKFYNPSSTYKYALGKMKVGDPIYASQLAGSFVLKGNETKKVAFIAGGIGITPFRSMIKYVIDMREKVDIVLIYTVGDAAEFAYSDELKLAQQYGVKLVQVVTTPVTNEDGYLHAKIDEQFISRYVPDYKERFFYISGPNAMVDGTKSRLVSMGVARRHIKKDHFSGY